MTRLGLLPILPCVLSSACAAPEQTQQGITADTTEDSACTSGACNAGCNLGFASEVYVLGWDQNRLFAADPARAFRVAHANGIRVVRVFLGIETVVAQWRSDRQTTFAGIRRMLDDAAASGLGLVVSTRVDQGTIGALAGHAYASWADAQRDLVSTGSDANAGYLVWLDDVVGTFGSHPAAYSWEATNEAGWMLGVDAGVVTGGDAAAWLGSVQARLHSDGAARVNAGGAMLTNLSDADLLTATRDVDILDLHAYPEGGDPSTVIAAAQAYVDRVTGLGGAKRSVMLGEVGTLPFAWFTGVAREAHARGWGVLGWELNGSDSYDFDDGLRPEVLTYLASYARAGSRGHQLDVQVVTSDGTGVPWSWTEFWRGGTRVGAFTTSDGTSALVLPPATYVVRAFQPAGPLPDVTVALDRDRTVTITAE